MPGAGVVDDNTRDNGDHKAQCQPNSLVGMIEQVFKRMAVFEVLGQFNLFQEGVNTTVAKTSPSQLIARPIQGPKQIPAKTQKIELDIPGMALKIAIRMVSRTISLRP